MTNKPTLITKSKFNELGMDNKKISNGDSKSYNRSYASKLLNWVEPYNISGYNKTLLYTEICTNLQVGDIVYIINGLYDSDRIIKRDRYKKGSDGYKVLYVDKCKVVLDIDFNNIKPYITKDDDSFLKVYNIKDSNDFISVNRSISTRNGLVGYKFEPGYDSIIYVSNNQAPIQGWGASGGITSAPGFFNRSNLGVWTNITSDILSNNLSNITSAPNIDRIKIFGDDIIIGNTHFKKGFVYAYDNITNEWIIDIDYIEPIISKSNFRNGNFKGEFNSGVYGHYNDRIDWHGDNSTWNTGVLINTNWIKGQLHSKNKPSLEYNSVTDDNGIPYQRIINVNNDNNGYNFIYDSNINSSIIDNGIFIRTNITTTQSNSIIENYILGTSSTHDNIINKGYFNNCIINTAYLKNSSVRSSYLTNSDVNESSVINSQSNMTLVKDSNLNSDKTIKILSYDEFTASENRSSGASYSTSNDIDQRVYKFYISEESYNKIKESKYFYIHGLNIINTTNVLNFFDKRFKVGSWTEYLPEYAGVTNNGMRGYDVNVQLSTPLDNEFKIKSDIINYGGIIGNRYTTVIDVPNPNSSYYSVDIWFSRYGINSQLITDDIRFAPNIIDISNAYILDGDFESGYLVRSNWNNGNHIELSNDTCITTPTINGGIYNISIDPQTYILTITTTLNINNLELSNIKVNDVVYLDSVDFIDSITQTAYRLPDSYKVISINANIYELEVIGALGNLVNISTMVGTFITKGAENRFNYIKRLKIDKTNIKSGIHRRSYIVNSLIQKNDYNQMDKDFDNMNSVRSIIISDSIFSDSGNILSKATYLNSHFVNGSDKWNSGIVCNSIWNGMTFSGGVFRKSRWINGTFTDGIFYNSRSYVPNITTLINTELENSYYRHGQVPNNKFAWMDGIFEGGEFNKSNWELGTFSNGKFYDSKFYEGYITGGVIGDSKVQTSDTRIYSATISYTTVENAYLLSEYFQVPTLNLPIIRWYNGVFNDGLFGTERPNQFTLAFWFNGRFNGGQIINQTKWLGGEFNNGKFLSSFMWTQDNSLVKQDYAWEDGVFNGGEFGNANGLTNSNWFTGEFNGGVFKGRVWNNGVFTKGEFYGSGATAIGGLSCSNANDFVASYTQSFYGKWRNGIFTNVKDKFIKDKKIYTNIKKASFLQNIGIKPEVASIVNSLWMGGTFSHPGGVMKNSVWLDGSFELGTFKMSSFNPYVERSIGATPSFNFNDSTCRWYNGTLENSEFYISIWENGNFNIGTASGMIWKNGICTYMNAFNIFWENGKWRNGNWYGSSFEFNGSITDDYTLNILNRGISWSGTHSAHIWNIFTEPFGNETNIHSVSAGTESSGWYTHYYDPFSLI